MKQRALIPACKECLRRKECCNMIAIIDYGMGNLHSVSKAVERLGYEAVITADPQTIIEAEGAILPGVGAFGDAMQNLRDTKLDDVAKFYAASGKPMLG